MYYCKYFDISQIRAKQTIYRTGHWALKVGRRSTNTDHVHLVVLNILTVHCTLSHGITDNTEDRQKPKSAFCAMEKKLRRKLHLPEQ